MIFALLTCWNRKKDKKKPDMMLVNVTKRNLTFAYPPRAIIPQMAAEPQDSFGDPSGKTRLGSASHRPPRQIPPRLGNVAWHFATCPVQAQAFAAALYSPSLFVVQPKCNAIVKITKEIVCVIAISGCGCFRRSDLARSAVRWLGKHCYR